MKQKKKQITVVIINGQMLKIKLRNKKGFEQHFDVSVTKNGSFVLNPQSAAVRVSGLEFTPWLRSFEDEE